MSAREWLEHYTAELKHAEEARAKGNEGMARVCARRAVGWVLGEYFERRGMAVNSPSAYERVQMLMDLLDTPAEVREAAGHFRARVTPEHELPVEADLIAEARWLKGELLGEATGSE
jgi:hypothetical protein